MIHRPDWLRTLATGTTLAAALLIAACAEETAPGSTPTATEALADCCAEETATASSALPETSLFRTTSSWQDRHGSSRTLADLAGRPLLTAMVFTNCRYACPRIVADMKAIDAGLPETQRDRIGFLLVSLDHERDTPEVLAAWARDQGLDDRWTLLHGDADAVRELAALLGVNYRRAPSGDYAHSNRITLLDAAGRIAHQQDGLEASPLPTVVAIDALLDE